MAHLRLLGQVEQVLMHRRTGQRRDGQGGDELSPGTGEDGGDGGARAAKQADQLERLVGRDPAAEDQKDALA